MEVEHRARIASALNCGQISGKEEEAEPSGAVGGLFENFLTRSRELAPQWQAAVARPRR
jgi:hypothetical protein